MTIDRYHVNDVLSALLEEAGATLGDGNLNELVHYVADAIDNGIPQPPIRTDYSREELIELCATAIVPMKHWHDRDSAGAVKQVAHAWALLRADAPFEIRAEPSFESDGCVTGNRTIWVEITWRGFNAFEHGDDHNDQGTFYIPTPERLIEAQGGDWY